MSFTTNVQMMEIDDGNSNQLLRDKDPFLIRLKTTTKIGIKKSFISEFF